MVTAMKHLKPDEISRLREQLLERERELRGEIRELLLQSDEQHHKDLAGLVADVGDESVANMLADLDTAVIDRHVHELRELEAARGRMIAGDYGLCADCGRDIDYERLAAFPAAVRCVVCQRQRETVYVHEATPRL